MINVTGDLSGLSTNVFHHYPNWMIPAFLVWLLSSVLALVWLFSFPRAKILIWQRVLIVALLLWETYRILFEIHVGFSNDSYEFMTQALVGIGILWQIYYFRSQASLAERQQMKWIIWGASLLLAGVMLKDISDQLIQSRVSPLNWIIISSIIRLVFLRVPASFLLISFSFAISKSSAWNVDFAINKTIVMTLSSAIVGIIFLVSLVLFRFTLAQLVWSSNSNTTSFLLSVFFAGILFDRVNRNVRHFIDTRIYGLYFDVIELENRDYMIEVAISPEPVRPTISLTSGEWTGDLIDGYEVLGIIAQGGMGEIYTAIKDNHIVAIKTLLKIPFMDNDDIKNRFLREMKILHSLQHPQIVKALGKGFHNGRPYLFLEYIPGQNLRSLIDNTGIVPKDTIICILESVSQALGYIHKRGFVHRDLKPANIILRDNGCDAILADFGLAKHLENRQDLTNTGIIGTLSYMAPEQIQATKDVDHRVDIYALSIITYEMLTGKVPFTGQVGDILFSHLQAPPPDPRIYNPDIHPHVSSVLLRALSKKREDRYYSAEEFLEAVISQF